MEQVTLSHLPLEIIEKILVNLPTYCILFNKPWVCKLWTNIVLKSEFWIRKLIKNKVILTEDVKSVLQEFERNIQVACLYHACLYDEHISLEMPLNDISFNKPPRIGAREYTWQISDDFEEMLMCSGILVTRSVSHAELRLQQENIPALPLLLKLLAAQDSTVSVYDSDTFWNCSPRSEYIELLKGQSASICSLEGCVTSLKGLIRDDIHELLLAIAVDEDNVAIDPGIPTTGDFILMTHFKAGSNVSKLNMFPRVYLVLVISGIESTHIEWMTNLIKRLCPHTSSDLKLILPNCYLNKNKTKDLLKRLSEENIQPIAIMCSSSTINKDDVKEITEFAEEVWPAFNLFDFNESNEELKEKLYF